MSRNAEGIRGRPETTPDGKPPHGGDRSASDALDGFPPVAVELAQVGYPSGVLLLYLINIRGMIHCACIDICVNVHHAE
jgi:hypothetical protein